MHTILVVDDERTNREVIVNHLKTAGKDYKFLVANDGQNGLAIAEVKIPDMIITDWDMPNMNGIEFIRRLKLLESTRDIPIIMATGVMTSSEHLDLALSVGASDFVRKPVDKIELLARTNAILALSDSFKTIKKQRQELIDSIEVIHSQRQQLIISERLGAVGEIAVIIAHEINTPLSAILASLEALEATVAKSLETVPQVLPSLSQQSYELFYKMIGKFSLTAPKISTREERKLVEGMEEELEADGIKSVEVPAKILVQNGISRKEERTWSPLFKAGDKTPGLLETIALVSGIYKQLRTVKNAADAIGEKIKAVKAFAARQAGNPIQPININESITLTLTLYEYYHRQGVEVIQNFEEDLPAVQALEDQVNLLWTYLLMGSIEEMKGKGKITITTQKMNESLIIVSFRDARSAPIVPRLFPQMESCKEITALHGWDFEVNEYPSETLITIRINL